MEPDATHSGRQCSSPEKERERDRDESVDGGGKCAEGVLLVIGANLILPFARRGLY